MACHTLILNNQAESFNLFFALAASVISRVGSAKGISNKQIFAFDVLEVKVISHNSAQHSLKSNGILPNGSLEYRSKWFVFIIHSYLSSIGVGMEPCETKDQRMCLLTSSLLVRAGMACMLSCFRGSGLTLLSVSVTPKYDNSAFLSWNLSTFSLICFCWRRSSKADSRASWLDVASSMVLPSPQMRMSSAMALVPSSPSKLSSILLRNSSGATLMPKGILFHFILPTGVLKVVSRELGSSSGTCQKADLM